ncbi:MAG: peptidylprolyl isomerase [bacterium]|nr:peptidylprolyl isomerase [bacterium]
MMNLKKLLALCLAVMLTVGCSLSMRAYAEDAADATAEEAAQENPLLVTVNGTQLYLADVQSEIDYLVSYYNEMGYDMTLEENLSYVRYMGLQTAISRVVLKQKAAELGLDTLTDEEMETLREENHQNWNELVDYYVSTMFGLTEESSEEDVAAARLQVLSMLESAGFTEESVLANEADNQVYARMENYVMGDFAVTDEAVEAYYQGLVESSREQYEGNVGLYEMMSYYGYDTPYYTPEGYRGVTHILLQVDEELMNRYTELNALLEEQAEAVESGEATGEEAEPAEEAAEPAEETAKPVTQADVDAAYDAIIASVQPTIDEIMGKLEQGVPFADLVAEYGTDPGMEAEPNKSEGYSVHMDSILWDPVFVKAAFSVDNVGDVAEPVVGSYGVHIVYYLRDVPAGAVAMTDEMRAEFAQTLLDEEKTERMNTALTEWMESATIEYTADAAPYEYPFDEEEAAE